MVTNEIQIFKNNEFGEIRTIIDKNGNPFFCLKDICDILEIGNPSQVKTRLDLQCLIENEVYINTGFGERLTKMTFVNEDGLYDCILDSNKPNARKIRKWVTSDILPSIRKTGMYLTDDIYNLMMKEPEKIGEMLIEYGKAKKENESLKLDNKIKEQQILELQPKAFYHCNLYLCYLFQKLIFLLNHLLFLVYLHFLSYVLYIHLLIVFHFQLLLLLLLYFLLYLLLDYFHLLL